MALLASTRDRCYLSIDGEPMTMPILYFIFWILDLKKNKPLDSSVGSSKMPKSKIPSNLDYEC